tara:strand:+ start:19646 stop:20242 length:597 start_codon:yes stop_codon:yes gene_type:complete
VLTILNYGLGNIRAFSNIYKRLDVPFKIASSGKELKDASKIIIPGVGSFDWAMKELGRFDHIPYLHEKVVEKKTPVLGVCVGMQIMADRSEEGQLQGLGWIKKTVKKFDKGTKRVPHMGWNTVDSKDDILILNELYKKRFYFLHSFYFEHDNSLKQGVTDYGFSFMSAFQKGNIYGVQFHPEKSHYFGIKLLENFSRL